jgi:hypothetical protein
VSPALASIAQVFDSLNGWKRAYGQASAAEVGIQTDSVCETESVLLRRREATYSLTSLTPARPSGTSV